MSWMSRKCYFLDLFFYILSCRFDLVQAKKLRLLKSWKQLYTKADDIWEDMAFSLGSLDISEHCDRLKQEDVFGTYWDSWQKKG